MTLRTLAFALVGLQLLLPATSLGQAMPLRRDVPAVRWTGCPQVAPPPVPAEDEQEAERLAAAAAQAAILGEATEAADLLARALRLNPNSPVIAYRAGRAEQEAGRTPQAVAAYCRYLALAPAASEAADIRQQVAALTASSGFDVDSAAAATFRSGLGHFDAGQLEAADSLFGTAAAMEPAWAAPIYNRAIVRIALNQADEAARDFRRFLELAPGAPEFNGVLDILGALRGTAPARYSPGRVAAAGLVIPGLGQFMTRRPGRGVLYALAAGGALAAGLGVQRTSIECLSPAQDGVCPPDHILRQDTRRPYLVPAAGTALGVAVLGAIDAYRGAQRANAEAVELLRMGGNDIPALRVGFGVDRRRPDHVVALITVRF